jgi:hypothetical protein
MLKKWTTLLLLSALCVLSVSAPESADAQAATPPFGDADNVSYAAEVWSQMDGYQSWKLSTPVYKGASPHGKFLRMFSSYVTVDGIARPIIVKENYGGPGVSAKAATDSPKEWLKAVTIMLQREAGYDDDNENWFWVKYAPDGSVMKNPKGMQLAGRVAKGMPAGCISCHLSADGGDYLYFND